jgi:hypothetical protein
MDKEPMLILVKYSNVNASKNKKARIEKRFKTLDSDKKREKNAKRAAEIMRKGAFNAALHGHLQGLHDAEKGYRMLCDDYGFSEQTEKTLFRIRLRKNRLSADDENYFAHLENIVCYAHDGENIESAVASVQAVTGDKEYEGAAVRLGEGRIRYLTKQIVAYTSDVIKGKNCGVPEFDRFKYLAEQVIETLLFTYTNLTEDDWGEINRSLRILRDKVVDNQGIKTEVKFDVSDKANKIGGRLFAMVQGQYEESLKEDEPKEEEPQKLQLLKFPEQEDNSLTIAEDESTDHTYFF